MEGRYRRVVDLVELTGLLQTSTSGVSIDDIADRFEVSRRTAERMLAALRERFRELEPIRRDGRKYWRLPKDAATPPLKLPEHLAALSERVWELEAQAMDRQEETGQLRSLVMDVMGSSAVGIFVLDSEFRVVWVNGTLETFFGIDRRRVIGHDKRALIRRQIRDIFENPDEFEERVLDTYDDNSYIEHFTCHVIASGERQARDLQHWSQPITSGLYAGGRIEHYVDVSRQAAGEATGEATPSGTSSPSGTRRQVEKSLADLRRCLDDTLTRDASNRAEGAAPDLSDQLDDAIEHLQALRRALD